MVEGGGGVGGWEHGHIIMQTAVMISKKKSCETQSVIWGAWYLKHALFKNLIL